MYTIKLTVDEVQAINTTEKGFWPFRNDRDEIYFAGHGGKVGANSSADLFTVRVPKAGEDLPGDDADYYGLKNGQKAFDIDLHQFQLGEGESAGLVFNLSEQDGADPGKLYDAFVESQKIGGAVFSALMGKPDPDKATAALASLKKSGELLYEGIDKTDDSIGAFALVVTNPNTGRPEFKWSESKGSTLITADYNSAYFTARGSGGSHYDYRVTAQIHDTTLSYESSTLRDSSWLSFPSWFPIQFSPNKNLILLGDKPIDGTGSKFDNIISGNSATNVLNGKDGNDKLYGNEGVDVLIGGADNDTLVGGSGTDRFVFNAPTEGIDSITDFSVVDDGIYISQAGFGGEFRAGEAITSDQFALNSAAQDSSDRFIYDMWSGALFFDADGIGAAQQVQIAQLPKFLSMTHQDIIAF